MRWSICWLLFVVIFFYSMLDAYQTKLLFDLGATELNPILDWMIEKTGTWKVIIYVKVFLLGLLGVCMFLNKKEVENENL